MRAAPVIRRTIDAAFRCEPGILQGLTWRHFGYVTLIAMVFAIGRVMQTIGWSPGSVALHWIPLNIFSGIFILLCATMLINSHIRWMRRPVALAIAVMAGCTLALLLYNWLFWSATTVPIGHSFHKLRVVLLQWGLVVVTYYFIERSARRARELREAELERRAGEAQLLEARLQVLQAQTEPHFLFNTLAHVQRLCQIDSPRGRAMLDAFCGYLSAALPHMRGSGSTLAREVDLARAYLDIQRIRMGRRLAFEIVLPQSLRSAAFPPMMLLPLVENAIKHGLGPLREGGSVRLVAAIDADELCVTVRDTGSGLSKSQFRSGDGVGLSNIRARLSALYGGRGRLGLSRNVPNGVVATIVLPLRIDLQPVTDRAHQPITPTAADSRALDTVA